MAEAAARRAERSTPADVRARRVIAVWNERAWRGQPAEFFPTFETALAARCWRVTYCCPACRTLRSVDLRDYAEKHHPRAPISALIPMLSCDRCCPNPPLAVLVELGEPCASEALLEAEPIEARAPKRQIDPLPRPPTLGELASMPPRWIWLSCNNINCSHKVATAIVPFVIRWGPDAPGDLVRRLARCRKCGHKGATTHHPSWISSSVGCEPFPTDKA